MPIEIRRFGIGNRRPSGPPGSSGVTGGVIHGDASGVVTELAFNRGGRLEPHANPNACWFIVIEGGGWVQVGEARARVAAGDAVSWPPDLEHGAWTEGGEMRAIVVELVSTGAGVAVLDGSALALLASGDGPEGAPLPADGALHEEPSHVAGSYDPAEGEPR